MTAKKLQKQAEIAHCAEPFSALADSTTVQKANK